MTLHPQAVAAKELWSVGPSVTDPGFGAEGIAAMRADALAAAAAEPREDVARVLDVDAEGVPCRFLVPAAAEESASTGVVVYLHGGGFVFGDVDTHDAQARRIANRSGLAVLAVDYRRPPEHSFPAAPDDAETALGWLVTHGESLGVDPARVAVLGDSAGANLALVTALRQPTHVRAAVLVYPFLDPQQQFDSYGDPESSLTPGECAWFWEQYAETPEDLRHPHLAPLASTDLSRLPPTLVQPAEHDVLREEGIELARRLRADDVEVELTTYAGMIHGFWRHPELFDAAEEALAEMADFLARTV